MSELLPWTSSKKDIYQAYKEILKKYETLMAHPPSPKQVERSTEINLAQLKKVQAYTPENLVEGIHRMKQTITKTLEELAHSLEEESRKLLDLRQASRVARDELEKLTDAKIAAEALEVWLHEHEAHKRDLLSALEAEKQALEKEIEQQRKIWLEETAEREKQIKVKDVELKRWREREAEEYQYRKEQQLAKDANDRQNRLGELERELQIKQAEFNDEFSRQKTKFEHEKEEIDQLRQLQKSWPDRLAQEINRAKQEITVELATKYETEISLLKQKGESEGQIAEVKLQNLQIYSSKLEEQIEQLTKKLEQETSRVHQIASKAVESSAGATAFEAVNRIAMEQAKRTEKTRAHYNTGD